MPEIMTLAMGLQGSRALKMREICLPNLTKTGFRLSLASRRSLQRGRAGKNAFRWNQVRIEKDGTMTTQFPSAKQDADS